MKLLFNHRIFSVLLSQKALRTGVLALGLIVFGGESFAQVSESCGMWLTDTIGQIEDIAADNLLNKVCLNRQPDASPNIYRFKFLIKRPEGAAANKSWLDDGVWSFPTASGSAVWSWKLNKSLSEANPLGWDILVFELTYDPAIAGNRNATVDGSLSGKWPENGDDVPLGVAQTTLLLRPSTTRVDSIYFDVDPLCQGAVEFKARYNESDNLGGPLRYFYPRMYYRWTVTLTDGTTLVSPTIRNNSWTPPFDEKIWFNAAKYKKISLQRAFCNTAAFSVGSTNSTLAPGRDREFLPYDLVSNPPLDTAHKEDTLYRLVWWSDSTSNKESSGSWKTTPMSDPICVSYYDGVNGKLQSINTANEPAPSGFTATGKNEQKQAAQGFLFFQVGTKPDTSVRYEWIYDTALVERMFYGQSWYNAGLNPNRWSTLLNGSKVPNYVVNGGFGEANKDSSSFRAIFRIKALTPERRAELAERFEGDGIVIKVRPICYRCKDGSTASGYFENDTLSSGYLGTPKYSGQAENLSRAWDTTKPMNYFEILKVNSATSDNMDVDLGNTDCLGATVYFNTKINALWQYYQRLVDTFNISKFVGGIYNPNNGTLLYSYFKDTTIITPGATTGVRSEVICGPTQEEQIKTYLKYIAGANECFTRKLNDVDITTQTFKIQTDSAWARLQAFTIQRHPRKPSIFDPYANRMLNGTWNYDAAGNFIPVPNPDTIYICTHPLLDSVGNLIMPSQLGVSYILSNPLDSLTFTDKKGNWNVFPTGNFYHGWLTADMGDPIKMDALFTTLTSPSEANHNSSMMIFPVLEDDGNGNRVYNGEPTGILMFAANGLCGRGDSVVIPYRLRDTFNIPLDIGFNTDSSKTGGGPPWLQWDDMALQSFCENTDIYFRFLNNQPNGHRVIWTHPKSWKSYYPSEQIAGNFLRVHMTFGQDSGRISFHTVNHCGGNKGVSSPEIKPTPYYRANWLEYHDTICEDSVYTYTLKDIKNPVLDGTMSDFYIKFPNDWKILRKSTGKSPSGEYMDTATESELMQFGSDDLSYQTEIGQASGNILVRWLTMGCDVSPQVRPEWWDTLSVFTRIYPVKPLIRDVWKDTVCARDTIWYSVKPDKRDSLQDNYYIWSFPNEWIIIDSTSNMDSVRVVTGEAYSGEDTIVVTSMCLGCDEREGGVLKSAVKMWDTAIFNMNLILDAITGEQFGERPCAGDTVQFFVNKPYLVDSINWLWGVDESNMAHNVPTDLQIESSSWFFTDTTTLPDTLALMANNGASPLYIQMSMRNKCGWSHSPVITLRASDTISPDIKPEFIRFDSIFCASAEGIFSVNPVDSADRYIWHFPWMDTVVYGSSEIALTTIFPTDTGDVFVIAANNCSRSDTSKIQHIDTIRRIPQVPHPANFALSMATWFGHDTLFLDTTCKNSDFGLKVLANPNDGDLNVLFNWIKLGGDTALQSPPLFENIAGRTDTITVMAPSPVASVKRTHTYIGVAASQSECSANGDTLRLLLVSIDTVQVSSLGKILMSDLTPCFGSTVTFWVEKDSAFAYRWILPENDTFYRFVGDTTKDSVRIQVGKKPAQIGVVSTSGEYCGSFENSVHLLSDTVKPVPAPEMDVFEQFPDSICEGSPFTFKVKTKAGTQPKAYRWIFPEGWIAGSDTITQTDSVNVIIGRSSGKISVSGIDSCGNQYPNEGDAIDSAIFVFRMPEIRIVGDMEPCYGETYTYNLLTSDRYVYYTPLITAVQPSIIITPDPPQTPNLSQVKIVFQGDSVDFAFSLIGHNRCPSLNPSNYTTTIRVFGTKPASLNLTESSPDTVCQGSTHRFVVTNANSGTTGFVWTLPGTWEKLSDTGVSSDTLWIKFDSLPANGVNSGTIQVNSQTKCYTDTHAIHRLVVIDTIPLPSPVLDATKDDHPFFQRPCKGDTMVLFVRENNPRYTLSGWTWNGNDTIYPDSDSIFMGWHFYDTAQARRGDTLSLIVSETVTDTLHIAISVKNSCDSVKTYSYTLIPTDIITEKTTFVQPSANLCSGEDMTFTLNAPDIAENFYWHFSWEPTKIDTIYNSPEHKFVVPTTPAQIWVIPANGCGPGPNSDTLKIDTIFARPNIVKPVNFAWSQNFASDTVRDTICLRSDRTFVVEKNKADSLINVTFNWFYVSGDSLPDMHANIKGDTLFVPADLATTKPGKHTILGVSATREFCTEPGDTLWFDLTLVDTVPLNWLGTINLEREATHTPVPTNQFFCSTDTLIMSVNNLEASYIWAPVNYRWASHNTTWQIINDSATHQIRIVVGTQSGVFSVIPLTDYSQRFCSYSGRMLLSDTLKIYQEPVLDSFVAFPDTVCADVEYIIKAALNPNSKADAYRFTVYQHIYNSTHIDSSLVYIQKADSLAIKPNDWELEKITVKVQAIDSNCLLPLFSESLTQSFVILNSPKVFLVGDTMPCRDSSIMYLVQPSDPYVTYQFSETHTLGVVVNANMPYIDVDFLGDSVHFKFDSIIHRGFCSNFGNEPRVRIYSIGSDTTPEIPFTLIGPAIACMNDTVTLIAQKGADYKMSFAWKLPSSSNAVKPWAINRYIGESKDTAILVTPEYAGQNSHYDTIFVYASGTCGTSKYPKPIPIKIDPTPDDYYFELHPNREIRICEDSVLTVWLTDPIGNQGLNTLKIRWHYPDAPAVDGKDTLTFNIPKNSFYLSVSFFKENTCGYSAPSALEKYINVNNQPAVPKILQNPWPCKDLEFGLSIAPDSWSDSIVWDTVGTTPQFEILNSFSSYTLRDSLHFNSVGKNPFRLVATAINNCGRRSDTILITPSDSILSFPNGSMQRFYPPSIRYCEGDTVIGVLKIPEQHVHTRPEYHWTFPTSWQYLKDSINPADTTDIVWFIPGKESNFISVWAESKNGCGATDTIKTVREMIPTVILFKASQSVDTALYKDATVQFYINPDSIRLSGQPANINAFDFAWTPADRFTYSDRSDTANLTYAYMTNEIFVVNVKENDITLSQQCTATDTVRLYVKGTYKATKQHPDSVCSNAHFQLEIIPEGGESETYAQQWFRYDNGTHEYVKFNDVDNTIWDSVHPAETEIKYLVVGMDTLFGNPEKTIRIPVSDTLRFTIKALPPVFARIDTLRLVQVRGDQIRELIDLNVGSDSVRLGERIRFYGKIIGDGRSSNYPHYIYEWLTPEDLDEYGAFDTIEYAGYNRTDSLVVHSGLIFYPQTFYLAVKDTATFGCYSRDSVFIGIHYADDQFDEFGRIPGGFSPRNHDGVNDIFLKGVDELTILNRWGMVIFQSANKEGWDGREGKTKRMVEPGDYFYIITVYQHENNTTKPHTKTGVITVF